MTSWFGLVKLLSYNVKSDLGYVGSIVLYGITKILWKVAFNTNMSDSHGIAEILLKVAFKPNKTYYHGKTEIRDCRDHDHVVVGFIKRLSWLWSYGSWIYNYPWHHFLSPLWHSLERFPLWRHIIQGILWLQWRRPNSHIDMLDWIFTHVWHVTRFTMSCLPWSNSISGIKGYANLERENK